MNPILSKRVDLRASSPVSRHTDPKALVGGNFLRTNFAGPRCASGWLAGLGWAGLGLFGHQLLER